MGNLLGNGSLSLISEVPQVISSLSGIDKKAQNNIVSGGQNIANAMVNTQNPLYQQLYGQFNQYNKANAAGAISAADAQNRLNSAMGRAPLFSPERNGQESFRQSVLASQNAGQQAQQQSQQALTGSANALNGTLAAANSASTLAQQQRKQQVGGYNSIAHFLDALRI